MAAEQSVPETFTALALTCETCGDRLDEGMAHRLIDGECPGCRYGHDLEGSGCR
jgi:hypothetical protein